MTELARSSLGVASAGARGQPEAITEPLDGRLALGAACAWLAVLVLVDDGARSILITAVTAAVCGAAVLTFLPHRWRAASAVALGLFCAALVLLPLAGRVAHAQSAPLSRLAHRQAGVTLDVSVTADPHVLAAKGPAGAARVAVETKAESVSDGMSPGGSRASTTGVDGAVLVLGDAGSWRDVLPGQRVRLTGSLRPELGGGTLSVTLFERGPPQLLGRPPWYQRVAGQVRSGLRHSVAGLPSQERGLLPGLVDGDTTNLDPVLAEHFKLAGLTHLVAVSGTNCSIVIGIVLLVLRRMRVRPWLCAVVGGLVLVMFVLVARPSPSVLRAALMAVIALASLASGRPRAALPALSGVVIALLLWDPTLAGSASFAMSVLATAALLVIAPGWARALRARGVPLGLAESVAVAAAAHLVTAPVVAALSGQVSIVAIPANVLAEPVVAVTTVLGFGAAVVASVWLPVGVGLAWVAGWPCRWLVGVADSFGGLHGAVMPWSGGTFGGMTLLAVLVIVILLAVRARLRRVLAAAAVTAVVVLIPVRAVTNGWPADGWVFVACDIGQGDALVLNAGHGAAVLVDAGPDPVPVDRCLRDLGVASLPLVVLTHLHLDHVGGLAGAVRGRAVGAILAGPLNEPATGSQLVARVAGELHRPVRTPAPGTHLQVGAVSLDVLGPAVAYRGTRSDPNNSSLVMRATIGGLRIMLPGDAEIEAQSALLASGADLRADVLKVPHHGSAYSDPAFLAAVHASVAVVSVGLGNDYGHPSPVLLREMTVLGVPLVRTDRDGDIAEVVHSGGLTSVIHGKVASAVGAADQPLTAVLRARPEAASSVLDARMTPCQRVRSASTTCPTRCHRSSCSWGTRSFSSIARSARSPPLPSAPTRA